MHPSSIHLQDVGQIASASVEFGDLTVLVGPQATGKSVFLEILKLVVDYGSIQAEMKRFSIDWGGKPEAFFDLYFGDGMARIWQPSSQLVIDGTSRNLSEFAKSPRRKAADESVFFIPAQRVMSLRDGITRPFTEFRSGDPFVIREFSERLHQLVQNEFGREPALFPKMNRLKEALRKPIADHIFGGFSLRTDTEQFQRRIVLSGGEGTKSLSYLVWSAGQREFVPLLLGLYWLMPPAKVATRAALRWVVIEEPEMGLHPDAISVVLSLVLELLSRGYRVCLSTHSPHVLDVVWALQFMKQHGGTYSDVLKLFQLQSTPGTRAICADALNKQYRTFFFPRDGHVKDISGLNPGASDAAESGWGGLSGFSGRVSDVVAAVARRSEGGAK